MRGLWSLAIILATSLHAQVQPTNISESKTTLVPAPIKPQEPLPPEKRADIYMARKMYREAIDLYKTCPQTAVILNKIGIAYHQLMELNTAKKFYERSVKLNRQYAEAVNNLGTIYYAKRSYRRAVGQYRKALKLTPDSASVWSNLGTAWFARKKYKQASECYMKALSLDPDIFEHRSTFGVMIEERRVEERAKFHYYLAKTYAQAGQTERALQYIRKSLEEGFKDRKKYLEEPEFAALQQIPEFQQLMAQAPRAL